MISNNTLKDIKLIIVSENEDDKGELHVDNKNLERLTSVYTNYINLFFKEICGDVIVFDSLENLASFLQFNRDCIVLPIWSGSDSRNRMVLAQAICESFNVPYIGADCYAKMICQDKFIARSFAERFGFKTPNAILIEDISNIDTIQWLDFPIVMKPNMEGSSIGIRKIDSPDSIHINKDALQPMLNKYHNSILVEEFIAGREVAIVVYGERHSPKILGALEVVHENQEKYFINKIFDYKEKNKGNIKRKCITSEIPNDTLSSVIDSYKALGKVDFMRIDGRINEEGDFIFIEFSPMPNFSTSGSIAALVDGYAGLRCIAEELIMINLPERITL